MFQGLHPPYGAILVDPPWQFETWSDLGKGRAPERHYRSGAMSTTDILAMPVRDLAADNCVLFLWCTWPTIRLGFSVIDAWGFTYKTCAFDWVKAKNGRPSFGLGYWTRSNSEPCLLATRGHPKRVHADVSQIILAERREHSRKPDCIHARIERLVDGPYLELFARQRWAGWDVWGDEIEKFDAAEDVNAGRQGAEGI